MNSEKHYHEEYNINNYNQLDSNCIHSEWGDNNLLPHMPNLAPTELERLFNKKYTDEEQYQVLQQSEYSSQFNPYAIPINIQEQPMMWNIDDEPEYLSSEKQYQVEEYKIQNFIHTDHQNNNLRSHATLNRGYSHRSSSASSCISSRDNTSTQQKSSSFENKSSFANEESSSLPSGQISQRKKKFQENDSQLNYQDFRQPMKNKQSQHKNVVKNIGLGFKNYLTDSKSPLKENIQQLLKENSHNHLEFRQWIIQSVKLDQKKEIYKALNIKQDDSLKIQSFKKILSQLFKQFFEGQYASSYLERNSNIQNKDIHLQFIKHFIISSRDLDYLLKKWK